MAGRIGVCSSAMANQEWGKRTSGKKSRSTKGVGFLTSMEISSLVLDDLSIQCHGKDVVLTGLYYDFAAQKEQSPENMLGVILKQVIDAGDAREYISHGFHQRTFGLPDLARMLKKALSSWKRAFICIDGLDECLPENRALFLESLREIRYLQGVRLFITGRRGVRDEIEKHLGDVDALPIQPSISDLMNFAKTKLDKDKKYRAMDNHLKEDILRDIPGKISETCVEAPPLLRSKVGVIG